MFCIRCRRVSSFFWLTGYVLPLYFDLCSNVYKGPNRKSSLQLFSLRKHEHLWKLVAKNIYRWRLSSHFRLKNSDKKFVMPSRVKKTENCFFYNFIIKTSKLERLNGILQLKTPLLVKHPPSILGQQTEDQARCGGGHFCSLVKSHFDALVRALWTSLI